MGSEIPSELKRQFFVRVNQAYSRCLWPFADCEQPAARAHSIQNANVLDVLQQDGHVIMPVQTMRLDREPVQTFQSVGRNQATTFTGLCQQHDSDIFRIIDTSPLDCENTEQLFLLAYRSVIKEYHTTLECAQSILCFMVDRVKDGTIEPELLSHDNVFSIGTVADSYEVYLYWSTLNLLLSECAYDRLRHNVFILPSRTASIAVSSVFPLQVERRKLDIPPLMIFNIFPNPDGSHTALFSYLAEHTNWANAILARLHSASGNYLLYEISKLVLEKCGNFVLSPAFFATFSNKRRATMLQFFSGNISGLRRRLDLESEELMLFN